MCLRYEQLFYYLLPTQSISNSYSFGGENVPYTHFILNNSKHVPEKTVQVGFLVKKEWGQLGKESLFEPWKGRRESLHAKHPGCCLSRPTRRIDLIAYEEEFVIRL